MSPELFDYIIVGGGLAGSVLSNQLFQSNQELNILVVEAGPDVSNNTVIPYANNTAFLIGSELDWGYVTVPQTELGDRNVVNPAGKCLGGGTAINSCGWVRGDRSDYDLWAEMVGDERYSYDSMLPYFIQTEEYYDASITEGQHGDDGPLYVATASSTGRRYPLREKLAQAWTENHVQPLPGLDANAGNPKGRANLAEDRRNGLRQLASSAYPLNGIRVLTDTLVNKILIRSEGVFNQAIGIETADGKRYYGKEIIASAGSYRTPQLLMLSGIGPKETLSGLGIPTLVDSPEVGQNLHDHLQFAQFWQLKDPSAGYAVGGNPIFNQPQYGLGMPIDWVTTTSVPKDDLIKAITADEGKPPSADHPLLRNERAFLEHLVIYAAGSASNPVVPANGTHISSSIVSLMPTSKGFVTISSQDPKDPPVIDPRYLSTEVDRFAWRTGMRTMARLLLGTEAGRSFIHSETPPDAFEPLGLNATDEYLDARASNGLISTYHPMGTCSMGKVVDTEFRVHGVANLRVVDASVIPTPIAAHIQAGVYALSLRAAEIIAGSA